MIAGRKLLVADDSPAYRKLLDLTFTDEGMEVTTVGDGKQAWERLEQSLPHLVLADVFMPEIGGYELCNLIKQDERFGRIPVILLVGLHEPFDEAEARRVGADDVVTKPFKSIRGLVSRVGSLLGGKTAGEAGAPHEYSTLGLAHSNASPAPDDQAVPETNVTVFVEAAAMTETDVTDATEAEGATCAADIELQTADTMQLEPIDAEMAAPTVAAVAYAEDDTAEMWPVTKTDEREDSSAELFKEGVKEEVPEEVREETREEPVAIAAPEMSEQSHQQVTPANRSAAFDDSLLDLGDFDGTPERAIAGDLILDLEYEERVGEPVGQPQAEAGATASAAALESAVTVEGDSPAEVIAPRFVPEGVPSYEAAPVAFAEFQEWAVVTPLETTETPVEVTEAVAEAAQAVPEAEQTTGDANLSLSPETIDAIARRAVEHLSEKVVREIAWEVVPELAELLIKKKLEEEGR